jgi:hypothetical protein
MNYFKLNVDKDGNDNDNSNYSFGDWLMFNVNWHIKPYLLYEQIKELILFHPLNEPQIICTVEYMKDKYSIKFAYNSNTYTLHFTIYENCKITETNYISRINDYSLYINENKLCEDADSMKDAIYKYITDSLFYLYYRLINQYSTYRYRILSTKPTDNESYTEIIGGYSRIIKNLCTNKDNQVLLAYIENNNTDSQTKIAYKMLINYKNLYGKIYNQYEYNFIMQQIDKCNLDDKTKNFTFDKLNLQSFIDDLGTKDSSLILFNKDYNDIYNIFKLSTYFISVIDLFHNIIEHSKSLELKNKNEHKVKVKVNRVVNENNKKDNTMLSKDEINSETKTEIESTIYAKCTLDGKSVDVYRKDNDTSYLIAHFSLSGKDNFSGKDNLYANVYSKFFDEINIPQIPF